MPVPRQDETVNTTDIYTGNLPQYQEDIRAQVQSTPAKKKYQPKMDSEAWNFLYGNDNESPETTTTKPGKPGRKTLLKNGRKTTPTTDTNPTTFKQYLTPVNIITAIATSITLFLGYKYIKK